MICEFCDNYMEAVVDFQRKNKKVIVIWCPCCGSLYINRSGNIEIKRIKQK